jgi:hypothetical protein
MKRRLALVGIILTGLCATRAWADAVPVTGDPDGSIALAERMETFAHQMLRTADVPPQAWTQSTDLLKAAVKLDPNEPRYARLLADGLLSLDDSDGAITALRAYTKLQRDDQFAEIQLLDLYLAKMQSADQKIAYLRAVLDKEELAPEVRSAAAVRCAQLLAARLQTAEALKMLSSALTLDHLNSAAMRAKYDLTSSTVSRLDRVQQLLNLLMACPADPVIASKLAQQLADAALVNSSVQLYGYANELYGLTGVRPDADFALGAASELMIADRADDATSLIFQYVSAIPDDVNGWLLRATVAKYQAEQNIADKTIQANTADVLRQTSIGLTNCLLKIRAKASADSMATTQPMEAAAAAPLPDLSGDTDLLRKSGRPELADAYIRAVSTLAWYDLYFAHDAAGADPLLNALQNLLGPQDNLVVRLQGWRKYVGGDPVGASTKLVAIQDTDPLAALGLVMIDLDDAHKHDDAVVRGKRLLSGHPSGFIGATIFGALRKADVTLEVPPNSEGITEAMSSFPSDFLQIVTRPQSFYIVHAEPTQFTYEFGEPVMVRVMIENIGQYDLAIGGDAALHPDLWGDATLRGLETRTIAGAGFERFGQRLVLPVGQTITTLMRVDDGPLYTLFNQEPRAGLTFNMGIMTNPASVQSAGAGQPALGKSGPCGYGVQLSRMILRSPVNIATDDEREGLLNQLHDGDGGTKVRVLDILTNCVSAMRRDNTPGAEPVIDKFVAHIKQATTDDSPSVAAWARFCLNLITTGDDQAAVIAQMQGDKDHWQSRLMAMLAQSITGGTGVLPAQLSTDPDPIVREFAVAMAQRLAASTPTTQPASASP